MRSVSWFRGRKRKGFGRVTFFWFRSHIRRLGIVWFGWFVISVMYVRVWGRRRIVGCWGCVP